MLNWEIFLCYLFRTNVTLLTFISIFNPFANIGPAPAPMATLPHFCLTCSIIALNPLWQLLLLSLSFRGQLTISGTKTQTQTRGIQGLQYYQASLGQPGSIEGRRTMDSSPTSIHSRTSYFPLRGKRLHENRNAALRWFDKFIVAISAATSSPGSPSVGHRAPPVWEVSFGGWRDCKGAFGSTYRGKGRVPTSTHHIYSRSNQETEPWQNLKYTSFSFTSFAIRSHRQAAIQGQTWHLKELVHTCMTLSLERGWEHHVPAKPRTSYFEDVLIFKASEALKPSLFQAFTQRASVTSAPATQWAPQLRHKGTV
jgi:hypothetical protein